MTPAYLAYLERMIRARFGLEGAPLRMFLKARPRNGRPGAKGGVAPEAEAEA